MSTPRHLPARFLKIAFHLLYYQLAWTYDVVAWLVSFGQWTAWRRTATLFLQEGPVLELAYGTGGLMADMAAGGLAPVGLDLSPYMARITQRRLVRQGIIPRLVHGQAQHLPFPDASFANVISTFPTEFILDPQTLGSIARILQPGGCLVVVAIGYLKGPEPLRGLVEWLYQITGQREFPKPKPLARLEAFGFNAQWQYATLGNATARLLVATRR
ncbi:MAG: methyltransferase domain-containing protein [Anaerolineales bacterium]|nr:MAG: methyltransferase domain-containing protein [Anaerolineales bacterium]